MYFCTLTTRGLTFLSFQGSPAPDPEPSEIWKSTLQKHLGDTPSPNHPCHIQGPQHYSSLWKGEDPWTPSHSIDGNLGTRKDGGGQDTSNAPQSPPFTLHIERDTFIRQHSQACRCLSSISRQISFLARKAGGGILLISIIHGNAPNILRTRFPFPREDSLP